jgi:hypothetical protein
VDVSHATPVSLLANPASRARSGLIGLPPADTANVPEADSHLPGVVFCGKGDTALQSIAATQELANVSLSPSRVLRPTTIPVSELAQIVKGRNPQHRSLFDPTNHSAFWIRVGTKYPNPAISLNQQNHP